MLIRNSALRMNGILGSKRQKRKAAPNRIYMRESKPHRSPATDSNGFTLVEIIAVLAILGIIGSITARKVIALDTTAIQKSFEWSISELNSRENLTWSKIKISDTNWVDDLQLFAEVDCDLGPGNNWSSKTAGGGTLHFKGQQIEIERLPSTSSTPGTWRMK